MSSEPIRIVLIDDHAVVRKGLRAFLDTYPEIEVVGEAGGGSEGVALVARVLPDVALMDLLMPEMDGIEATRQIKQVSPSTQVIVLTSYGEDERIFPAIKAGALSYLLSLGRRARAVAADPAPPHRRYPSRRAAPPLFARGAPRAPSRRPLPPRRPSRPLLGPRARRPGRVAGPPRLPRRPAPRCPDRPLRPHPPPSPGARRPQAPLA